MAGWLGETTSIGIGAMDHFVIPAAHRLGPPRALEILFRLSRLPARPTPFSGRAATATRGPQGKPGKLLTRMEDFDCNVLAFTHFEEMPFTNNQAERHIRMVKTRQ